MIIQSRSGIRPAEVLLEREPVVVVRDVDPGDLVGLSCLNQEPSEVMAQVEEEEGCALLWVSPESVGHRWVRLRDGMEPVEWVHRGQFSWAGIHVGDVEELTVGSASSGSTVVGWRQANGLFTLAYVPGEDPEYRGCYWGMFCGVVGLDGEED